MFQHLLTPVGDSLALSFTVATLPIIAVLITLGVPRRPDHRPHNRDHRVANAGWSSI